MSAQSTATYTSYRSVPQSRSPRIRPSWLRFAAGGVAAVAAVVTVVVVQQPTPTKFGSVVVAVNVDADVAGNGLDLVHDAVVQSASALAESGGGRLTIVAASGGAAQVVANADLNVERDGQQETDAQVRDREISNRVTQSFKAAESATLSTQGRNLLPLLVEAADLAPPRNLPYDIFYIGFGLATVDPIDARIQMGGDPNQAVAAVSSQLPKLTGARLHGLFPAAVDPQPALNTATAAWRKEYWNQLALATGASLVDVQDQNIPGSPAVGAPTAPVIPNLPDPTPPPPTKPTADPPPTVLGGAQFQPDSPEFASKDAAAAALASLVTAWETPPLKYSGAKCVGRTAAIGPASTAIKLSQQRADNAAAILRSHHIPVTAKGVGFGDLIPEYPATDPHQRAVTCQLVPKSQ